MDDKKITDKTRIIYTSQYETFANATCLFVEYHDIIKSPMFFLLFLIQNDKMANEIFDLSEIKIYHNPLEMFEWYNNRKYQNIFECFPLKVSPDVLPETFYRDSLNSYLQMTDDLYDGNELSFANIITKVSLHNTIVKNVVIYNEIYNPLIEADIKHNFPPSVKFACGDFRDILPTVHADSTFVFSDLNKLNIMAEMNLLNYRSVIAAKNFRYNTKEDGTLISDVEKLMTKFEFHFALLNVF